MMNYLLTIHGGHVTTFNKDLEEWSGEEFYKTVDIEINFSCDNLEWEIIAKALIEKSYLLSHELTIKELTSILRDSSVSNSFPVIENGEGLPDYDGEYLVDYWYTIKLVSENINLLSIQ